MSWRRIRGRFLFREVIERGFDLPLASVTRDGGVEYRADLEISVWNPGDDTSTYKRVLPGDFVIGLRSFQSGLGYSDIAGLVSPAYTVLRRTTHQTDGGFYRHLFKSREFISRLENVAKGIRQGRTISADDFYDLDLPVPPLDEQRAIADFLDMETARIDALIANKRRMIELLEERASAIRREWFRRLEEEAGLVAVRRLVRRIEQGWSPVCDNNPAEGDEWGVLKTSAVTSGSFDPSKNKRLPVNVDPDLRWQVEDGDLLVTRGSGSRTMVARAAVARVCGSRLMISDLLYRLRPTKSDPDYLAACFGSPQVRRQIESSIRTDVGQTLKVRTDDLKSIRLPALPHQEQRREVRKLTGRLTPINKAAASLKMQLELFYERRQVSIAQAVTAGPSSPEIRP